MATINLGNVIGNRISGISSGLDTEALIKELSEVRQKPIDDLNDKITLNNTKATKYSELSSLLNTLKTSLNFLRNPVGIGSNASNIFQYRSASLSSSTLTASSYLNVQADPGALIGLSRIEIGQLAKALEQRSGTFNARDVSATTNATGSYFNAGTFQIGSANVVPVAGDTAAGFTLASNNYAVEGSASGIITADGIKNITVVGGSGGLKALQGGITKTEGTYNSGTETIQVKLTINGTVYTGTVATNQSINGGSNEGIAAGTVITFTNGVGNANETTFQIETASDFIIDDVSANSDAFITDLKSALSTQSVYQSRSISNFNNADVKAPLTGLTNSNISFYSNGFSNTTEEFGQISGFTVQKSTGSDGAISVVVGGETFRVSGLGTTVNSNLVLKSTSTEKELRINLADAGVSIDLSTDTAATALERALDYSFGTRELTDITVNAGDTLNDIIFAINTKASTTGATGSIIKVSEFDYRFNLKANNEGIDNKYDIFDTSGVLTNTGLSTIQASQDAIIRVDGVEIQRSTNSISDAIENVTLNLLQVTPNYNGGTPDSINISIDNDQDTVIDGIVNFLDAYNALRVFNSEQNERNENTGEYVEDAILGGDATLTTLATQFAAEISRIVGNTSDSEFDALTDVGIKLEDFAGNDDTIATKNILTFDETTLRAKLEANFDKVREVFEFKMTTDSTNLSIFKTSNSFTLSDFKLDIDNTRPDGQQVKLLDSNGVEILSGGQPIYLDAQGTRITGRAGTPVAGLEFVYTGDGTDVVSISISQGIADRMYNLADTYIQANGLLDTTVENLTEQNADYETEISSLQTKLEDYVARLQSQFAAMEQAISSVNNILMLLEANTNAINNQN